MGRDKRNENRTEQFTKWIKSETELPAFLALSYPARDAYFRIRALCFAETAQRNPKVRNNNGSIYVSSRWLAEKMGASQKTARASLADLQAKGFLDCTQEPRKASHGRGLAPHFRLTMMPMGQGDTWERATQEPVEWLEGKDYDLVCFKKSKPKPRNGRVKNFLPAFN